MVNWAKPGVWRSTHQVLSGSTLLLVSPCRNLSQVNCVNRELIYAIARTYSTEKLRWKWAPKLPHRWNTNRSWHHLLSTIPGNLANSYPKSICIWMFQYFKYREELRKVPSLLSSRVSSPLPVYSHSSVPDHFIIQKPRERCFRKLTAHLNIVYFPTRVVCSHWRNCCEDLWKISRLCPQYF